MFFMPVPTLKRRSTTRFLRIALHLSVWHFCVPRQNHAIISVNCLLNPCGLDKQEKQSVFLPLKPLTGAGLLGKPVNLFAELLGVTLLFARFGKRGRIPTTRDQNLFADHRAKNFIPVKAACHKAGNFLNRLADTDAKAH